MVMITTDKIKFAWGSFGPLQLSKMELRRSKMAKFASKYLILVLFPRAAEAAKWTHF